MRSWTSRSNLAAFSSRSAAARNCSAAIVFKTMFAFAMESEEPTMRNSNLFPVKAKGEVRFRSVPSAQSSGRVFTRVFKFFPRGEFVA